MLSVVFFTLVSNGRGFLFVIVILLRTFTTMKPTLTDKEIFIYQELANGQTNESIANLVGINIRTIESHRRMVLAKLNAVNGLHAIAILMRQKLIK